MASVFPSIFYCFILIFLPVFADAQTNGNFGVGETLKAATNSTSSWLSSSGDFAFGFRQLDHGEELFLLAIWYAKIPDKTIIWYPKNDSQQPVLSGSGSTITLTLGGLILRDFNRNQVWKSALNAQGSVDHALLNDNGSLNNGNLMLWNSAGGILWDSFKTPTDTLMQGQVLYGIILSSKLSNTSFSRGRFQASLRGSSVLVLVSINAPSNYISPYLTMDTADNGDTIKLNETGSYIINEGDSESDFYYRATLDYDGLFTKYSHPKSSGSGGSWKAIWSIPDNICQGTRVNFSSGVCGLNAECRIGTDNRPICECAIGYSLLDPSDAYGSCKLDKDPSCPEKKNFNIYPLAGSILLSGSGFINLVFLSAVCYMFYQRKLQKAHQSSRGGATETNLRCFTFKELAQATNGFREELGRGAFGIVYKGKLQNSNIYDSVAVKKLDRQVQDGEKEFKAEVNVIGQTQHRNLVRLVGFCAEDQNRLLVYEFLPNGTLANFLFKSSSKPSWNQRMDIAFSIARGLRYLHEECRTQIIHCDIKPQNILLDENFDACISDFGLAKLLMLDQSHTNTGIRGTKGYVAPEWFRNMPVTTKVDVYSFGVILLEIISCRKSVEMDAILPHKAILTNWAYDCYQEMRLDELVDHDYEALSDKENFERYVKVALWCIQEDPLLRPNMRKVIQMLEGVVEVKVPSCY